jgi:hypothetical protein
MSMEKLPKWRATFMNYDRCIDPFPGDTLSLLYPVLIDQIIAGQALDVDSFIESCDTAAKNAEIIMPNISCLDKDLFPKM